MAISRVGSGWSSGSSSLQSSGTVTVSGSTSNNLLIATIAFRASGTITNFAASGWTKIQEQLGTGQKGATFYKIANGSTDNFAATWSTYTAEWSAIVDEFSGVATTSPLEDNDHNLAYIAANSQSADTPINSGSVTPVSADGVAIASLMHGDERELSCTEMTIDSSYTEGACYTPAAGQNPIAGHGYKTYSTTAAQSPNWSTSRSEAWSCYPSIASFKEPAAGGTTVTGRMIPGLGFTTVSEGIIPGLGYVKDLAEAEEPPGETNITAIFKYYIQMARQ